MASNVILTLLMLYIYLSSEYVLGNMNISMDEDMEFERQLKILNKPSIKTIQAEDGNIFDCVSISKQPALDHPLLKEHEIQMKPSSFPPGMEKSSSDINETLQIFSESTEECPIGTVPIQRTTKEHLVRARSLLNDPKKPDPSRQSLVGLIMKPKFRMYGAGGRVSIYNLALGSDQFSSANVWVQSGPADKTSYITAGWMVSPKLYGDSRTRLFTYWTGDGNHKTGCYNSLCPGFVQVDRKITPSSLVGPASKYNGNQFAFKVQVYQDRRTGNWWFLVSGGNKDIVVGYWPKKLFPYLRDGTQQVAWGGIAQAGKNKISPPMGNGHFPDGNYRHACYFSNIHYVNNKNEMAPPINTYMYQQVDKPKCYGLKNDRFMGPKNFGYSFTFGGSGGKCG